MAAELAPNIAVSGAAVKTERPSLRGSVLQLATARGVAIVISFVTAPVIARLYPPHAYGALGLFTAMLSVLTAFASLSYVAALPIAVDPAERRDLFTLCALIGGGATVIVAAGFLTSANFLAEKFHEPDLARYAFFFPLLFLGNTIRQLLDFTLSCQRRFGAVALRNVLEMVVGRIVQLGACLCGMLGSPAGLITGTVAGSYVSAVAAGANSIRDVFRGASDPLRVADLRVVAAKYRKFPQILFWSQTINALTFGLPPMILGLQYSVEIVGLYGMAFMMVTLPLQLFTASANQVFYVEVADCVGRRQSAVPVTQNLIGILTALTSFPLAVVLVLGPLLFEIFLGVKWYEAGVFAQVLVPWMALMAIASPLSTAYQVLDRQGEAFLWNLILLAARFATLYVGGLYLGVRTTLAIFALASAAIVGWLILRPLFLLGVSRRWGAAAIIRSYIEPLLLLTPAGIAYWCFSAKWTSMAALSVATIAYGLLLCRRHPQALQPVLARLPRSWVGRLAQ